MSLDDILASLFGADHGLERSGPLLAGSARLADGRIVHVLGYGDGAELGVDEAIDLAGRVLAIANDDDDSPILFLVDSSSQRMSLRDELLGLSEYLAHLAKALLAAEEAGHRTVGLLYGGSAAGAFIAMALSCGTLVALPGAHPAVMDLPSMARVTKLSVELLTEKAEATPVFAPGLPNLAQTGAIAEIWDDNCPLGPQLTALLASKPTRDTRAQLGLARGGRLKAGELSERILELAQGHG